DIILKVRPPARHTGLNEDEVNLLREGQVLISFLWPAQRPDLLDQLSKKGVTTLAMDSVPRISRAQKMDALSSMANIAGQGPGDWRRRRRAVGDRRREEPGRHCASIRHAARSERASRKHGRRIPH